MSVKYICDGYGKEALSTKQGFKPYDWYARTDDDGVQHACSRPCIDTTSVKSGKTGVILLF